MVERTLDRFSVGIIGAGDIVTMGHLPVLLAMDKVSVVWITDSDPRKLESVVRAFRIKACELPQDPKQLPEADVILLAIPYGARRSYYMALRDRPSALYVEKPFAKTLEEHRKLCSWFPDYRLACGFQRRSSGTTLLVRRILDEKLFGPLVRIDFGFGKPGLTTAGKYYSDIGLAGGGILLESAIHGIDAILFCTRAVNVEIKCAKMIAEGGFDLHTTAELLITTERKECISCQVTVSCLQDTIEGLEFVFENAVMAFSFNKESVVVRPIHGIDAYSLSTLEGNLTPHTTYQSFYEFWSLFLAGLRAQQANYTSASQSILTTRSIEGLYAAAKNRS
jgi:predicted dehydrogenase